jgi:ketosteroid isomerase-like protein
MRSVASVRMRNVTVTVGGDSAAQVLTRAIIMAVLTALPRATMVAQSTRAFPQGAALLTTWFNHVQRDELDSLPALLAPDFVFVTDGARFDRNAFVAMIKGLGISHPRVQLSNITAHRAGDVGYLVYDRVESFKSRGTMKVVPETGTMVLTRSNGRWVIASWTTTSPPR